MFSTVRLPRLGLIGLATTLRQAGLDARVWCQSFGEVPAAELLASDLVGISVTTSTSPEAYRLARLLRHRGVRVVLGGPHVTFLPEEGLAVTDLVLRGEADETFPALVRCLLSGDDHRATPGLSYREGNRVVHNPLPPPVDLERLPPPDLGVLAGADRLNLYPVITSRGCPHGCTFCAVTALFGRRYRFRRAGQVVDELEAHRRRRVFFYDDNFTASPARTREMLELMLARRTVPRAWMAQLRVEAARDRELLRLMARTNCRLVHVGFESINPKTLRALQKGQAVEDIRHCIRALHEHGIAVHGMFMLGSDDDTVQTVDDTATFALEEGIDTAQFLVLTPIPGTRLFTDLERQGRILTRDWARYDGHHVVHRPARMAPEELQLAVIRAFSSFYGLLPIIQDLLAGRLSTAGYKLAGSHILRRWLAHHPDPAGAVMDRQARSYRLEGLLDRTALRRLAGDLRTSLGLGYRSVDVHLAGLELRSEGMFRRLVRFLDGLAARPGVSVRVIGVSGRLDEIIAGTLRNLPRFDCVGPG